MEGLDDDSLRLVFRFLSHRDLAAASCTSRRWRKVAEDDTLWEAICSSFWPSSVPLITASASRPLSGIQVATPGSPQALETVQLLKETPYARVPSRDRCTSTPEKWHGGTFRQFAYRRMNLPAPTVQPRFLTFRNLAILFDLTFRGQSTLSLIIRQEDLLLNETAEIGDLDFCLRSFPGNDGLPFCPESSTRMRYKDMPSLYAKGLHLRMDLCRDDTGQMLQLLASPPMYQADDLSTLVFCNCLPALPFGGGLLAEINLEYRILKHYDGILGNSQVPKVEVQGPGDAGGSFVRWEFRHCRFSVKRSTSFCMASCDEFMRYLTYLTWG